MKLIVSSKIVALIFGILVVAFLAVFYVIAWQEPAQAPPAGNVPAPLNVGPAPQTKEGDLTIQGFLSTLNDLVVGDVTIKSDGSESPNLNADKIDGYHAADLLAGAAARPLYTTKCAWACRDYAWHGYRVEVCLGSCEPPPCAPGDTSLVTGCAAMGGGATIAGLRLEQCTSAGTRGGLVVGYGYCKRVCRDE